MAIITWTGNQSTTEVASSDSFVVKPGLDNKGIGHSPVYRTNTFTTSSTVTLLQVGVNVVSGNVVHTLIMPTATSSVGARFTFRSDSAHAHILTCSAETAGAKPFCGTGLARGSRLALASVAGSSVLFESDGANFLVLATSGTVTIDQ